MPATSARRLWGDAEWEHAPARRRPGATHPQAVAPSARPTGAPERPPPLHPPAGAPERPRPLRPPAGVPRRTGAGSQRPRPLRPPPTAERPRALRAPATTERRRALRPPTTTERPHALRAPARGEPPRPLRLPAAGERRTMVIRGQVAGGPRRPSRLAHERLGPRPDRVAMWAVVFGVFLVLVAALSAHGL